MAALLRQGARRIGGSVLQRTKAAVTSPAVAEERRRLLPRRMYSTEEQATEELTRKIQQKKEELYDVICKAEQSFCTSSFSNKRLLQRLSVQVEPRQGAKWQVLRWTKRATTVVHIAGFIALTNLVTNFAVGFVRFLGETKAFQARMNEELREAREAKTRSGLMRTSVEARRSED